MSVQPAVDETSRFEQLVADLKIPSGDFTGVPLQLADAIAQAGLEASVGTIAFARKHSSGDDPVEISDQNGGLSSCWPQWAFELAKAAVQSQQCSAAEALEAVTRSWTFDCRRANSYVKCPSIFSWLSLPGGITSSEIMTVSHLPDEDQ